MKLLLHALLVLIFANYIHLRSLLKKTLLLAIVLLNTFSTMAAVRGVHEVPTIEKVPTLDGVMDEDSWKNAKRVPLNYENNPGEGIPAIVETVAYLYEDGKSLHIAIRAYDPNPERIRSSLRDRDTLWNDDNVGVIIDTFNDERSAFEFFVNPKGAQADMTMTDTNGWNEDDSWNAIWNSAAAITDDGWIAEMSIPFRALRFPDTGEKLEWNIALWRNYPRDVRHQFSSVQLDRNLGCNLCQFDKAIGFANVERGNNLQISPTITVGKRETRDELPKEDNNSQQMSDWQKGDSTNNMGLDFRWGITRDMVLNATINPDFSQVDVDDAQLDVNDTFSLSSPERRPFFLDGAAYFQTSNLSFIHTRNIANPDFGINLSGKTNGHNYGLLISNDNDTTFLIPGNQGSELATLADDNNNSVESGIVLARYKVDLGDRNNVGFLFTNRQATGYRNSVVSLDGSYWLSNEGNLQYQVAFSESKNPIAIQDDYNLSQSQNDYAYLVSYSHNTRDYSLKARYHDVGKDFRADMGFISKTNFKQLTLDGNRTYYNGSDDLLTRYGYSGHLQIAYDQDYKKLEQKYEFQINLQGQRQLYSNFSVVARELYFDSTNDNNATDGQFFDEIQAVGFVAITPVANLRLSTSIRFGEQIDFANAQLGNLLLQEVTADYQFNDHLNIKTSHNYNALDVNGGNLFKANQTDMRISYQFDNQNLLKLTIQYTDIERNVKLYRDNQDEDQDNDYEQRSRLFSMQLIYSYKINPQTLVYFGYSDGGFQNDNFDSIQRDRRALFAKFSYAWLP
jgi:hypothetical protein